MAFRAARPAARHAARLLPALASGTSSINARALHVSAARPTGQPWAPEAVGGKFGGWFGHEDTAKLSKDDLGMIIYRDVQEEKRGFI